MDIRTKVDYTYDDLKKEERYTIKAKFFFKYRTWAVLTHYKDKDVIIDISNIVCIIRLYKRLKESYSEIIPNAWYVRRNYKNEILYYIKFTNITKFYYWWRYNKFRDKIYNPVKNYLADLNLKIKMKFGRNKAIKNICDSYYK